MITKLTRQLTYSNLMASVAVFLALGGGAYALTVPNASVGAKQLKKNAVTAAKVRSGAIGSAKVQDNSLTGTDILESSLATVPSASRADTAGASGSAKTAESAATADSAKTADSAATANTAGIANSVASASVGANGLKTITKVESAGTTIGAGASAAETATCPVGSTVISGGSFWDVSAGELDTQGDLLQTTHSFRQGNSWIARGGNDSGTPRDFHAEAYCLVG